LHVGGERRLLLALILRENVSLRQWRLWLNPVGLVNNCLSEQLLTIVGIKLDTFWTVDRAAALARLMLLQLFYHLLLL
jgi:hypothetical protein